MSRERTHQSLTPEELATMLEDLAATVRERPPLTVQVDTKNRFGDMPDDTGRYWKSVYAGPLSAVIEIHW